MSLERIGVAVAAAALAACADPAYVEPSGPGTASLRIENQGPPVFGYELEADTYQEPSACRGRLVLASARTLAHGLPYVVRVVAQAPFTLTLRASGGGPSRGDACVLAGTFTPSAGERYLAIFRAQSGKCELVFVHQQATRGGARRYVDEPSYRPRSEPACLERASAPSSARAPEAAPPPLPGSAVPPAPR
jgi:hypothetical protein